MSKAVIIALLVSTSVGAYCDIAGAPGFTATWRCMSEQQRAVVTAILLSPKLRATPLPFAVTQTGPLGPTAVKEKNAAVTGRIDYNHAVISVASANEAQFDLPIVDPRGTK